MKKEEYTTKLNGMLATATYKELKKDPTAAQEAKIGKILRGLVRLEEMSDSFYDRLRPTGCQPPRIYGLPKIHKPGVPLRPVVSCIGSLTYQLARHVHGQTDHPTNRAD